MSKKVVSFLVSGRGSNFAAVAEKIVEGYIPAKSGIVISNREDAAALRVADEMGLNSFFVDPRQHETREGHEREIVRLMKKHSTDLIVAAGYMRILTKYIINKYHNKIINIHPALLPSFPGVNAQKQAFDYGVKVTGCTTHFVDEGTDTGPIILQSPVWINDDDTVSSLASKILEEEHRILPETVKLYCENRLMVSGRKVLIRK